MRVLIDFIIFRRALLLFTSSALIYNRVYLRDLITLNDNVLYYNDYECNCLQLLPEHERRRSVGGIRKQPKSVSRSSVEEEEEEDTVLARETVCFGAG